MIVRNGKEYLKVASKNWNNYLNIVSPYRQTDKSIKNRCALKEKEAILVIEELVLGQILV